MKIITRYKLPGSLLLLFISTSCSRPVAYFQPSAREQFSQTTPTNVTLVLQGQTAVGEASPAQQIEKASAAFDQVNALVSHDGKLAATKTVQKRLNRIRTLLASASMKARVASTETVAHKKATFMERMMLKKLNKRISRQLAPANPERTLASKSILALSIVLILGGILLLALTSGGGFALGAIAFAAGLVILLIELI